MNSRYTFRARSVWFNTKRERLKPPSTRDSVAYSAYLKQLEERGRAKTDSVEKSTLFQNSKTLEKSVYSSNLKPLKHLKLDGKKDSHTSRERQLAEKEAEKLHASNALPDTQFQTPIPRKLGERELFANGLKAKPERRLYTPIPESTPEPTPVQQAPSPKRPVLGQASRRKFVDPRLKLLTNPRMVTVHKNGVDEVVQRQTMFAGPVRVVKKRPLPTLPTSQSKSSQSSPPSQSSQPVAGTEVAETDTEKLQDKLANLSKLEQHLMKQIETTLLKSSSGIQK
jgi:hypothetical protein